MKHQIELRHLRYFLAVAEELHFRKAAEKLYISQPGLSRQIKQMEDDLGVKLFVRHNRKVKLTNAGTYLKLEITRNLKNLEDILDHAKLMQDGLYGTLKFGYVGSAMQEVIPRLLLQIKQEHPNILFDLKEMDNQKQINSLLSQDIDIGFVRLERAPRGLEIYPVLEEAFCLVLHKDHPIDATNFKDLAQLKDEPFILFDPKYSTSYYEQVMQIFDDSGYTPLTYHNTIHAASIYKLVENNFGISIVPKSLQAGYSLNIKFIELNSIPQRTTLSAVWEQRNRNPILNKVIGLIKQG